MRLTSIALVLSLLATAACGLAQDELQIDNDGGGKFSGLAGPVWKAEDLPQQVGNVVCGGAVPTVFDLRILDGFWLFSGNC